MAFLVTGTPGSGKTTLVQYAHSKSDDRFIDADDLPCLCEWRELKTGKAVGSVSDLDQKSDDVWFQKHGWYWRDSVLKDYVENNPDAIICGSSENIAEFYPLFTKIVILNKTEEELLGNLKSPERRNPFGKTTKQRHGFMEWQEYLIKEAEPYDPVIIEGNEISSSYENILELNSR